MEDLKTKTGLESLPALALACGRMAGFVYFFQSRKLSGEKSKKKIMEAIHSFYSGATK